VVQRNAAADMWCKLALGVGRHPGSSDAFYKRTRSATPGLVQFVLGKSLTVRRLADGCKCPADGEGQTALRQEVDRSTEAQASSAPFARKIRLSWRIARNFLRPVFWPAWRFLTGQLRRSQPLRTVLVTASVLTVVGCGSTPSSVPPAGSSGPKSGGQLTVSVRTEPRSFCAFLSPDGTTDLLSTLTQSPLVRIDRTTEEVEPWLAESWTRSDDGLRYTIKLKPNIRFSDGAPFTAEDVAFSLAAAYDPASTLADSLQVHGKRLQATVVDPLTITIVFPAVFGPGLRLLDDLVILPKHKLEAARAAGNFGASWGVSMPPADLVGLGPFVLTDYRPGERLVFARNTHYFKTDDRGRHLPYLDRLVVEIVPDQDSQVLKLQAGETDTEASEIRPEDYAPLKRFADQGTIQLLDLGVTVDPDALWINLRPGAFDRDPRRAWIQRDELRLAISAAVDRARFADTVFLGAAAPVFGPITPSNKKWFSNDVPRSTYDPSLAKQLLARIGLVDRNADGMLEDQSGSRARLTLLTAKGQTPLERGASVIRNELQKIGLTVDVATLDGNALIQRFVSGKDYDAVYFHLTSTSTDPALNRDFWLSSGDAHIWNPGQKTPGTDWERQIDELMARNAGALDEAERRTAFLEIQRIFAAHQPMLYFAAPRVFVAASSRMTNLRPAISRPQLLWAADTIAVTR
jgi:peptide/nickel transport system substrate-binding protein